MGFNVAICGNTSSWQEGRLRLGKASAKLCEFDLLQVAGDLNSPIAIIRRNNSDQQVSGWMRYTLTHPTVGKKEG